MSTLEAPKELYLEERRREIVRQTNARGRVSVLELSQQFGVSEVTIRADLQTLAEQGLLLRTHGGAVPAVAGSQILSLAMRRQQQVQQKNRIGAAGAALVADGDAIFLDSSSTALAVAQCLTHRRSVTVITNGLMVALEFLDVPAVHVVLLGGALRRETASLVGADGRESLGRFNIAKGFFGAHGIAAPEGLTDTSADEAAVKRPLVRMCGQVIAVLDATKWGRVGLSSFAAPEEIHVVLTDAQAPADLVGRVREFGVDVRII